MRENLIINLTRGQSLNDNDDANYYYVYNFLIVNGNGNDTIGITYNGVYMEVTPNLSLPGIIHSVSVDKTVVMTTGGTGAYVINGTTGAVSLKAGVTVFGYKIKKTMF